MQIVGGEEVGIRKCGNGHFFDAEKYAVCPICLYQKQSNTRPPEEKTICVQTGEYLPYERTVGYTMLQDDALAKPVAGWIVCLKGCERGRDWRIYEGKNYIGRSCDSDISIHDTGLCEKEHASIVYDGRHNIFLLVPGKGAIVYLNGTLLNDSSVLKDDDEIKLGETLLCFRSFCGGNRTWKED